MEALGEQHRFTHCHKLFEASVHALSHTHLLKIIRAASHTEHLQYPRTIENCFHLKCKVLFYFENSYNAICHMLMMRVFLYVCVPSFFLPSSCCKISGAFLDCLTKSAIIQKEPYFSHAALQLSLLCKVDTLVDVFVQADTVHHQKKKKKQELAANLKENPIYMSSRWTWPDGDVWVYLPVLHKHWCTCSGVHRANLLISDGDSSRLQQTVTLSQCKEWL